VIVLSTGGLYALLDSSDEHHHRAHTSIKERSGPLLLSPLVLQEVTYLVSQRLGREATYDFLLDVTEKVYQLAVFGDEEMELAADLMKTYSHMSLGLADASVAVIAGRAQTVNLLTVEQHFRAIGPLWGAEFRLLPFDE
jgi:predicted nucleic acid-binding protein